MTRGDKQRLKEAIWRIQGICGDLVRRERMPRYKLRIIDSECELLAEALNVEPLNRRMGDLT